MRKYAAWVFVLCLWVSGCAAGGREPYRVCGTDTEDVCATGSPWAQATAVRVRLSLPGSTDYEEDTFSIPDPFNLAIQTEQRYQGEWYKGTFLLVNGCVMLTRGHTPDLTLDRGLEIDALDGPVTGYQMAIGLLARAVPEGPEKISGVTQVDLTETSRGFKIATPSSSAYLGPPWTVKGTVSRRNPDTIEFALTADFPAGTPRGYRDRAGKWVMSPQKQTPRRWFTLSGEWRKLPQAPALDRSLSLEGWRVYAVGPTTSRPAAGITVLDYLAQPMPTNLRTLGELQDSLRQEGPDYNPRGTPDPRKNCVRGSQ